MLLAKCLMPLFFFFSIIVGAVSQQPRDLIRMYLEEVVNNRKLDLLPQIFADPYEIHILTDDINTKKSVAELRAFFKDLLTALPDIHYTIGDIIQEGDKAVIRATFNATHKGELFGYPASGNKIKNLSEVFFCRVRNGKIVEFWTQVDWHNLFRQLKKE